MSDDSTVGPARVDFYVVSDSNPDARERAACRLAEKAWMKSHRVFVHTASPAAARKVDELMWTFRQNSFLPHALFPGAPDEAEAVLVGDGTRPEDESDVLINLTDEVPAFYRQFDRVAEFVHGTDAARVAGRHRFRLYRDHGYAIESHNV